MLTIKMQIRTINCKFVVEGEGEGDEKVTRSSNQK